MSYLSSDGYVVLCRPGHPMADAGGRVYEHRMVAHDAGLLPPKRPDLHVHHINHDKTDNRPENLEVLPPREHHRHHREFSREDVGRLYMQGLTMKQVGAIVGTENGNVSRALAELG